MLDADLTSAVINADTVYGAMYGIEVCVDRNVRLLIVALACSELYPPLLLVSNGVYFIIDVQPDHGLQ